MTWRNTTWKDQFLRKLEQPWNILLDLKEIHSGKLYLLKLGLQFCWQPRLLACWN